MLSKVYICHTSLVFYNDELWWVLNKIKSLHTENAVCKFLHEYTIMKCNNVYITFNNTGSVKLIKCVFGEMK